MGGGTRVRAPAWLLLGLLLLTAQIAAAEDARPNGGWSLFDDAAVPARPDRTLLTLLGKDLQLKLFTGIDEHTLKVPLAPGEWSFLKDVQPYAALSPSTARVLTDATLSAANRETADEPWKDSAWERA